MTKEEYKQNKTVLDTLDGGEKHFFVHKGLIGLIRYNVLYNILGKGDYFGYLNQIKIPS